MSPDARPIAITLPDGAVREFTTPPTGAGARRLDQQGPGQAGLPGRGRRRAARPVAADRARRAGSASSSADDPAALPHVRHDCAHVMAEAVQEPVPRHPGDHRPGDRGRLLLRLLPRRAVLDRGPRRRSRRAWPRSSRPTSRSPARWSAATRRARCFDGMGERFKLGAARRHPGGRAGHPLPPGRLDRPLPRPARPVDRPDRRLQADQGGRAPTGAATPRNPQLQRIYGTAFASQKELDAYLHAARGGRAARPPPARPRDGPVPRPGGGGGLGVLAPEGLDALARGRGLHAPPARRSRLSARCKTPQLIDRALWERSGHWEKFGDNMFTLESRTSARLALKPMNCPGHVQIFNQGLHSYRDLPLRMAEFGACHRNEPSGALHGIMRVRAFTQDDAHIFCTPEQITAESVAFCDLLMSGLPRLRLHRRAGEVLRPAAGAGRRATRSGTGPRRRLREACDAAGLDTDAQPRRGRLLRARSWSSCCATPSAATGSAARCRSTSSCRSGSTPAISARTAQKHRPVMLHRAILGSLERFIGILIEHYAGRLPLWLAPVQAVVATVTNEADAYAGEVADRAASPPASRADADLAADKISYKVRQHSLAKVPLIMAVGRRERPSARSACAASAARRRRPCA